MGEKRHVFDNGIHVAGKKHLRVHPGWRVTRADRVSTGGKPVFCHAVIVHDLGMGVENVAECFARPHHIFAGKKRFTGRGVHGFVARGGAADAYGLEIGTVIAAPSAGEFEIDLVFIGQHPPARLIAA